MQLLCLSLQHLGTQLPGNIGHGGPAKRGHFGKDIHRGIDAQGFSDGFFYGMRFMFADTVDNDGRNGTSLVGKGIDRQADAIDHALRGFMFSIDQNKDGTSQVAGHFSIDIELKCR